MGAKCNITSSVIEKFINLQWGIATKNVDGIILENYIEFLACPTLDYIICNPSDCNNNSISVTCNLSIAKITALIVDKVVTFSILNEDILNGLAPYTYKWEYETNDFDNSGVIDTDKSVLTVKSNKKASLLVTNIKLTITDSNNCIITKSCYLTPQGMQCINTYIPCMTITNLLVTNKRVQCVAPSGLLVFKK